MWLAALHASRAISWRGRSRRAPSDDRHAASFTRDRPWWRRPRRFSGGQGERHAGSTTRRLPFALALPARGVVPDLTGRVVLRAANDRAVDALVRVARRTGAVGVVTPMDREPARLTADAEAHGVSLGAAGAGCSLARAASAVGEPRTVRGRPNARTLPPTPRRKRQASRRALPPSRRRRRSLQLPGEHAPQAMNRRSPRPGA
jgi:hypothetical protein